jgi:hypothetical protein
MSRIGPDRVAAIRRDRVSVGDAHREATKTPLRPLRQHMRTLQPAHGEVHPAEWAARVSPSVPYMQSWAGGIKNADVQDPDSIRWRDDPWPREPPKPCACCGTWTAPNFTIGHRAREFPGGPGRTTTPFTNRMVLRVDLARLSLGRCRWTARDQLIRVWAGYPINCRLRCRPPGLAIEDQQGNHEQRPGN